MTGIAGKIPKDKFMPYNKVQLLPFTTYHFVLSCSLRRY